MAAYIRNMLLVKLRDTVKIRSENISFLCQSISSNRGIEKRLTKTRCIMLSQNHCTLNCCFGKTLFHTSTNCFGIMEFFDDPKNFGVDEVKTGRAWTKDDLRIKSNSDLHKLWYVLLKEKNMLLTMEYACKKESELFPNPERLDKVRDSMSNIEEVVKERNRAFHELETGETGERPFDQRRDAFGRSFRYRKSEHIIPEKFNSSFRMKYRFWGYGKDVLEFNQKMEEKKHVRRNYLLKEQFKYAATLLKMFPDMDMNALKEKCPDINIDAYLKEIGDTKYEDFESK